MLLSVTKISDVQTVEKASNHSTNVGKVVSEKTGTWRNEKLFFGESGTANLLSLEELEKEGHSICCMTCGKWIDFTLDGEVWVYKVEDGVFNEMAETF